MSRARVTASKFLQFSNLYTLLDCLMIFGASIVPSDSGTYRLQMVRPRRMWGALAWAVIVTESQDEHFSFLSMRMNVTGTDRLEFYSRYSRFLAPAYQRWYRHGDKAAVPGTLMMSDELLAFWLVGCADRTRLAAPGLSLEVAGPLILALGQQYGWAGRYINDKNRTPYIELPDARDIEHWLEQRVPRTVWDRTTVS